MKAMVLSRPCTPLELRELPTPEPASGELLLRVEACGVCRTDLHIRDGELDDPRLPLIPGHEVVGRIEALGSGVKGFEKGQRVGVPWLAGTCGKCEFCRTDRENLCSRARFTGYHRPGGYAEATAVRADFALPLPHAEDPARLAPLLCAGLIGGRALRFAGDARRLGLFGFGAAAHLIAQVALYQGRSIYAFTRPGDFEGQAFARSLGACWAGGSDETPPELLDAALLFAPVGALVPRALECLAPGGTVVCAGIHMSEIPAFDYGLLWPERQIRSVANLTRRDGRDFLALAAKIPVHTEITCFPLEAAEEALDRLRAGQIRGAAVLLPE